LCAIYIFTLFKLAIDIINAIENRLFQVVLSATYAIISLAMLLLSQLGETV